MRCAFILLLAILAAASPFATHAQQPPVMEGMRTSLPRIEVVRVKRIDPRVQQPLRFQLSDGSVDLMKAFSLSGFEGIGGVWNIPSQVVAPGTFDARYGQW
jgi:hypothetical protein